jgi:hypothetical protein
MSSSFVSRFDACPVDGAAPADVTFFLWTAGGVAGGVAVLP